MIEVSPEHSNHLTRIIQDNRDQVDLVVIGGSDGSNHAAKGLVDTQLPFGILPLGTANDLARTLGCLPTPASGRDHLSGHKANRSRNGEWFLLLQCCQHWAGYGVTRQTQPNERADSNSNTCSRCSSFVRVRPFSAKFASSSSSSQDHSNYDQEWPALRGGMTVDEQAQIDDGCSTSSVWKPITGGSFFLLPALRSGKLVETSMPELFRAQVRSRLFTGRGITADGEIVGRTPATFRLVPSAVSIFVPVTGLSTAGAMNKEPSFFRAGPIV